MNTENDRKALIRSLKQLQPIAVPPLDFTPRVKVTVDPEYRWVTVELLYDERGRRAGLIADAFYDMLTERLGDAPIDDNDFDAGEYTVWQGPRGRVVLLRPYGDREHVSVQFRLAA